MPKKKDYDVGHGKPPKDHQFKRGESGNPKGRPKGVRNFKTDLKDTLDAPVTASEGGATIRMTTQQAALARLRQQALSGKERSLDRLLDFAERYGAEQEADEREKKLAKRSAQVLDRWMTRKTAEITAQVTKKKQRINPKGAKP